MKRFLNNLRTFTVALDTDESYRYVLNDASTPEANELFIGSIGGLFIYKTVDNDGVALANGGQIFCLSHDDFTFDFLYDENTRLNAAYDKLINVTTGDLTNLGTVPTMPDEDGVA